MNSLNKNVCALAICLSALAGCVDAIGFLHLGGYFISFMSGNSTRLSVHIMAGDLFAIKLLSAILVLFVMGTTLGVLVRHFSGTQAATVGVLTFITILLLSAAICYEAGWNYLAIGLMTLAMGAENAVLQRNGDVVVGLTYMTGTLVKVGQRLAGAILGGPKLAWLPYLLLWLGLICGGVAGTILYHFLGMHSLWLVTALAFGLTIITALFKHKIVV